MPNYVYPTFMLDTDDFEKALPTLTKLVGAVNLPCRYWRKDSQYAITFKDEAINKVIYCIAHHEHMMIDYLTPVVAFELTYTDADTFNSGKELL